MSGQGKPPPKTSTEEVAACPAPRDFSAIVTVALKPSAPLADYLEAMRLANAVAAERLGPQYMLLSWYDRDRDFESPQHVSECHAASAVPGYVDYALGHGATLKVDVDGGRFVFFYRPVED